MSKNNIYVYVNLFNLSIVSNIDKYANSVQI